MKYKFAPSLMCMNLLKLEDELKILNERADILHVDIMDGHFVKNITLSPFFIESVRTLAKIPIDAHLMVEYPSDYLEETARAGADFISIHAETINKDAFRIINKIKNLGCKVGIVLNPATLLEETKYYIHLIDKLTIMSVDPGFAGQKFIVEMTEKIRQAKEWKKNYGYDYSIEIDGSCNEKTFKILAEAGAEIFIVGSSGLFGLDTNLEKAWDKMIEKFGEKIGEIKYAK